MHCMKETRKMRPERRSIQWENGLYGKIELAQQIRGSIMVSISACHADDPGLIPGRGVARFAKEARG